MTSGGGTMALLRSVKLALALLLVIALVSMAGTTLPAERRGDFYRSPFFALPFLLLGLNILFCTWHRISSAVRVGGPARGRALLDGAMHLSFVVILLGVGLKEMLSTVGTQYLFTGVETASVYDAEANADVPLGFSLLVKERVEDFYPLAVMVGVSDAATGEELTLLDVREGRPAVALPGGVRLSLGGYDLTAGWISVRAESDRASQDFRLAITPGEGAHAAFDRYGLALVAWRRDLKRVRGLVAVLAGGKVVKEEWLVPNGRIGHDGASVYLTTWGEDRFRNPYLGVQVTRDPGAAVFWVGAILLAATLPLFIVRRRRPGTAPAPRAESGLG